MSENITDTQPLYPELLGCWRNLDPSTEQLLQLTISGVYDNQAPSYKLHVVAAGKSQSEDWGCTSAEIYLTQNGEQAAGFHGLIYHQGQKTAIAMNLLKGIAVVQSYTVSVDGGAGIFSKEYFHRGTIPGVEHDSH